MKLEEEIKQKRFRSEKHKAVINLMYTGNWVYSVNKAILKQYNLSPEQYNVLRILRGQYPILLLSCCLMSVCWIKCLMCPALWKSSG